MAAASPSNVPVSKMKFCANCRVFGWEQLEPEKLKKCSKCKIVQYCNASCQREHWMLVHRQRCQDLASIGDHGISFSDFKLLDDPLQDLVTQADKILHRMASNKSDYTKVLSQQLDQLQKEVRQGRLNALAKKEIYPKAFNLDFEWNMILKFLDKNAHLLDQKLICKDLWSTLLLVLGMLPVANTVDLVNNLKTPRESVPAEFWVGFQQEIGVFSDRVADLIKALSGDQIPSFKELLKIFCGGSLCQTCSFCKSKMTVAAVFREALGDYEGTPTVSILPFLPPLFSCGATACIGQMSEKEDACARLLTGLDATCARLSGSRCDYCFLRSEKVHR